MSYPVIVTVKYAPRMERQWLIEYLNSLIILHDDYQGLYLSGSLQEKLAEDIAQCMMVGLETLHSASGAARRQQIHGLAFDVAFRGFRWTFDVFPFSIFGTAFRVADWRAFRREYGDDDVFAERYARKWIAQGVCDDVIGTCSISMANAWGTYMGGKDRIMPGISPLQSQLSACGNWSAEARENVSAALETLHAYIADRYGMTEATIYEVGAYEAERIRQIDSQLLADLGEGKLTKIADAFGMRLDEWLAAV